MGPAALRTYGTSLVRLVGPVCGMNWVMEKPSFKTCKSLKRPVNQDDDLFLGPQPFYHMPLKGTAISVKTQGTCVAGTHLNIFLRFLTSGSDPPPRKCLVRIFS